MFTSFHVELIKAETGRDMKILRTFAWTEAAVRIVEMWIVHFMNL
jgi:hypothetical protein